MANKLFPVEINRNGNTVGVTLLYPPYETDPESEDEAKNKVRHVEIDMMHVRASDGIRVHYDFDRDGWVIEQPQVIAWETDADGCDEKWKEVAFIQSWGSIDNEEYKRVTGEDFFK